MTANLDVLIVGAGAAGIAAAITLALRGRNVMLVDKRFGERVSFGEVLPPNAAPHLTALGMDGLFDRDSHLASWQQYSSWGRRELDVKSLTMHPHGCAWHLDRGAFENTLLAGARRAGAEVVIGAKLTGLRRNKHARAWDAIVDSKGLIRPRFLIDATGRASTIAKAQGARRIRRDRLIALLGFAKCEKADQIGLLVEACPTGWWYTAKLPNDTRVAALLTDPDQIPSGQQVQRAYWARAMEGTSYIRVRMRIDGSIPVVATPAGVDALDRAWGEGWLAVGDAAAAFDPLSSMGIVHALDSGRMGGLAVDAALAGEFRLLSAYQRILTRRVDECDILRRSYYAVEPRWPENHFWSRRGARR